MSSRALPIGVIPARARSTRFPGKVIAPILKKPMIQYVWEAASRAGSLGEVLVATDDRDVLETAVGFGAKAVLTPDTFQSGTDRVAFAVRGTEHDIVVNLQGDEPLIRPESIDQLVKRLMGEPELDIATLAVRRSSREERENPNVVKVVLNRQGRALYFSRAPLLIDDSGGFLKHIGIYAYRRRALERFCDLPQSQLERAERLEQLRALENNMSIAVVEIEQDTIAVDTHEDLERVEAYLMQHPLRKEPL